MYVLNEFSINSSWQIWPIWDQIIKGTSPPDSILLMIIFPFFSVAMSGQNEIDESFVIFPTSVESYESNISGVVKILIISFAAGAAVILSILLCYWYEICIISLPIYILLSAKIFFSVNFFKIEKLRKFRSENTRKYIFLYRIFFLFWK